MATEHDKDVWRWDGLLAWDALTLWAAGDAFAAVGTGAGIEITSAAAGALFFGTMAAGLYPVILGGLVVAVLSSDEGFSKQWGELPGAIGLGVSPGTLGATVLGALVAPGDAGDMMKAGGAVGPLLDLASGLGGAASWTDRAVAAGSYLTSLPGTYLDYQDSGPSQAGSGKGQGGSPSAPVGPSAGGGTGTSDNAWPGGMLYPFSPGGGDLLSPVSSSDSDSSPYDPPDGTLVFSMQPSESWNSTDTPGDSGVYSNSTGAYGGSGGSGAGTPTDCPSECADCAHECADCTHECADCSHECSDCSHDCAHDCSDCGDCGE